MKSRTKWILAALAALAFVALCILSPAVGLVVGTAAAAVWAGLKRGAKVVGDLLKGEAGIVEGQGDTFAPVPSQPTQIDVWVASEDPAAARRVQLPDGMTAAQVKAVRVIPGGKAVVEVLP